MQFCWHSDCSGLAFVRLQGCPRGWTGSRCLCETCLCAFDSLRRVTINSCFKLLRFHIILHTQAVAIARTYLLDDRADLTCQPAFRDQCARLTRDHRARPPLSPP